MAGSLSGIGRDLLEIGCGSEDIAENLSRLNPGAVITATDLDPVVVDTAARRLADRDDVTDLPFADDAFDSVVSCLMVHHVLRPGGTFTGYDLARTPLATWVHRLGRSPFRLLDADEMTGVCAGHGLSVQTTTVFGGHAMRFTSR